MFGLGKKEKRELKPNEYECKATHLIRPHDAILSFHEEYLEITFIDKRFQDNLKQYYYNEISNVSILNQAIVIKDRSDSKQSIFMKNKELQKEIFDSISEKINTQNNNNSSSITDELFKLQELKDKGSISEEEFVMLKQKILDK